MIYPWFERWLIIQKYVNIKIDLKYERMLKWVENVQKRESIKTTKQTDEFYMKRYGKFFE